MTEPAELLTIVDSSEVSAVFKSTFREARLFREIQWS